MDIKILASGSSGNAYKISDGRTSLLLEAGISIQRIKEELCFKLSDISGCLVTHEHGDHSKAVKDMARTGIDVYLTNGTRGALNLPEHHRFNIVESMKQFIVGTFIVMPFKVEHDAAEPVGYLVQSTYTGEKLAYITDSFYSHWRFKGLTHIMVEVNYADDILDKNMLSGSLPQAMKDRLIRSHMSLDTCKDFLKANDLSQVQGIWLLHLSNSNSDEVRFKREVQEITGKVVVVA